MKKRKIWKKELFDRKSKKQAKKKKNRRKRRIKQNRNSPKEQYTNIYEEAVTKRYVLPGNFSLTNNMEETALYLSEIINRIFEKIPKTIFWLDSSNVKYVTVDALIYLIAVIENMKLNRTMSYTFKGNLPREEIAEKVYQESGFIEYIKYKGKKNYKERSKFHIRSGTDNNPMIAKGVCDFVITELKVGIQDTLFIQKILVELMSNSYYHAYPGEINEDMYSKWYLYVEHVDKEIRIIFVDTGKGISGTVRRKFSEKIKGLITGRKDEDLLYYAFEPGDYIRTETGEAYRGNGLPGIKKVVEDSPIHSFWAFSGSGGIHIYGKKGQKQLTKHGFSHKIYGTIMVFEFEEGGLK